VLQDVRIRHLGVLWSLHQCPVVFRHTGIILSETLDIGLGICPSVKDVLIVCCSSALAGKQKLHVYFDCVVKLRYVIHVIPALKFTHYFYQC